MVALSISEGAIVFRHPHRTSSFFQPTFVFEELSQAIDIMNSFPSMTLDKFIFGLQATSLIWINWIPNDIVVRQNYQDKAINVSHNIQAATAADDGIILGAELAVTGRNEAVADERRQTSPLGLIFALMLKPETKPVEHFRNKYARDLFGKTYNECLRGEQLKVCNMVIVKARKSNRTVNTVMRRFRALLAGVHIGAVVAVGYTVLNDVNPVGVGLQLAAAWTLAYCAQVVCARFGGTTTPVWGAIVAAVAGESWRPFGAAFGGAMVATCGAIAGGFAAAYLALQWQHFPVGPAVYLFKPSDGVLGRPQQEDFVKVTKLFTKMYSCK